MKDGGAERKQVARTRQTYERRFQPPRVRRALSHACGASTAFDMGVVGTWAHAESIFDPSHTLRRRCVVLASSACRHRRHLAQTSFPCASDGGGKNLNA